MTNNAAEHAIRPLTLGRKNYLFAGSDASGRRAAILYTLTQTATLNSLDGRPTCATSLPASQTTRSNRIGQPAGLGRRARHSLDHRLVRALSVLAAAVASGRLPSRHDWELCAESLLQNGPW
jgi:hypothetical protein